ncbi:hypothetical protein HY450_00390 [Candidatus Pacearchaeota archaeon]|nr:hypothetical protein [Candidatus Pacearchaeota archaeon]
MSFVFGMMRGKISDMLKKDYKFFMDVLMESDILKDNPRTSYVHMNEIEINFQSNQYF